MSRFSYINDTVDSENDGDDDGDEDGFYWDENEDEDELIESEIGYPLNMKRPCFLFTKNKPIRPISCHIMMKGHAKDCKLCQRWKEQYKSWNVKKNQAHNTYSGKDFRVTPTERNYKKEFEYDRKDLRNSVSKGENQYEYTNGKTLSEDLRKNLGEVLSSLKTALVRVYKRCCFGLESTYEWLSFSNLANALLGNATCDSVAKKSPSRCRSRNISSPLKRRLRRLRSSYRSVIKPTPICFDRSTYLSPTPKQSFDIIPDENINSNVLDFELPVMSTSYTHDQWEKVGNSGKNFTSNPMAGYDLFQKESSFELPKNFTEKHGNNPKSPSTCSIKSPKQKKSSTDNRSKFSRKVKINGKAIEVPTEFMRNESNGIGKISRKASRVSIGVRMKKINGKLVALKQPDKAPVPSRIKSEKDYVRNVFEKLNISEEMAEPILYSQRDDFIKNLWTSDEESETGGKFIEREL